MLQIVFPSRYSVKEFKSVENRGGGNSQLQEMALGIPEIPGNSHRFPGIPGYFGNPGSQEAAKPQPPLRTSRTRTNTNPNDTEANAAGRSGNARALRKQSKCGMIQEGEGHWPNSSKKLQKARNLWVLRTLRRTIKRKAREQRSS